MRGHAVASGMLDAGEVNIVGLSGLVRVRVIRVGDYISLPMALLAQGEQHRFIQRLVRGARMRGAIPVSVKACTTSRMDLFNKVRVEVLRVGDLLAMGRPHVDLLVD